MLYTLYTPHCTQNIHYITYKQIQVFGKMFPIQFSLQNEQSFPAQRTFFPTETTFPTRNFEAESIHAETYGYLLSTMYFPTSIHLDIQPTTKEYEYKNKRKQKHENLIKQLYNENLYIMYSTQCMYL